MASQRHCMLEGVEICLTAASLSRSLGALMHANRMDQPHRQRLINESKAQWEEMKERIDRLNECDARLVDTRGVSDIEANMRTLDPMDRFLDQDGPFIAGQVDHLLRFELLTSLGGVSRTGIFSQG